jgi:thiol-disulfide isomerase/thioredoxin
LGFFATWCLPCRYEVPQIIASYEKHKDEIQFVYIDQEEGDHVVQAFIQRESIPYPILMDYDSEVARSYRVLSLPATFFIDSNGRIVNYHLGLMSPDMLENHIQELIGH